MIREIKYTREISKQLPNANTISKRKNTLTRINSKLDNWIQNTVIKTIHTCSPSIRRLKQENHEFQASLVYTESSRPAWNT